MADHDRLVAKARVLLGSGINAMLEPLRLHGHDVVVADISLPLATHLPVPLSAVEIVLVDATVANRSILAMLSDLTAAIGLCDAAPRIVCFSTAHRNPRFVLDIEQLGARYVRVSDAAMLLEAIDLVLADMKELRRNRPCFHILHRFAVDGVCREGEEVFAILFPRAQADPQLRLGLSERLTFNLLAEHIRLALDARQIAAAMNALPFYREHAGNSGALQRVKVRVPAVKVIVGRIRRAIGFKFAEANLRIDPLDVLQSSPAAGTNRVLYRLNADIHFIHSDD